MDSTCQWETSCWIIVDRYQKALSTKLIPTLAMTCVRAGFGDDVCNLWKAWLAPRTARVIVQSHESRAWHIAHQVYQGTVLGPPLWNIHFADVSEYASANGFTETKFAHDLSCEKAFILTVPDGDIMAELHNQQSHIHKWGATNRVEFDPGKEELRIIHPTFPDGEPFHFLARSLIANL